MELKKTLSERLGVRDIKLFVSHLLRPGRRYGKVGIILGQAEFTVHLLNPGEWNVKILGV